MRYKFYSYKTYYLSVLFFNGKFAGLVFDLYTQNTNMKSLQGKKVAILTETGFEEVELTSPKQALEEAGAEVQIISPQKETVKAWDHDHWSIELKVDKHIDDAHIDDYDALMLPGGVLNPDKLRTNKNAVNFAKD